MVVDGIEAEVVFAFRAAREQGSPIAEAMLAIAESCAVPPVSEIVSPNACAGLRRGDTTSPRWDTISTD